MGWGVTTLKSPPPTLCDSRAGQLSACQIGALQDTQASQTELTTLAQILFLVLPLSISDTNTLSINLTQKSVV